MLDPLKAPATLFEAQLLCIRSIVDFSKQPNLLRIYGESIVIFGDFHGHWALSRFFAVLNENGKPFTNHKYVFLGNYIDHGPHSLNTLCFLLGLKHFYPDNIFLLRGTHECPEVNREHGFYDDLIKIYGKEDGEKIFSHFNDVFAWMPVAALVGGKVLCVHGGISPHLRSLEDIEKIDRPLYEFTDSPLAYDLLNAVFTEKCQTFQPNPERPFSVLFGENNVMKCLHDLDIGLIIRGNQFHPSGYKVCSNGNLYSLFSAINFKDGNSGAAFTIRGHHPLIVSLEPVESNLDPVEVARRVSEESEKKKDDEDAEEESDDDDDDKEEADGKVSTDSEDDDEDEGGNKDHA